MNRRYAPYAPYPAIASYHPGFPPPVPVLYASPPPPQHPPCPPGSGTTNTVWTTSLATAATTAGPIIEDLVAPPRPHIASPPMGVGIGAGYPPPLPALTMGIGPPVGMVITHATPMPQIQDVYGIRPPTAGPVPAVPVPAPQPTSSMGFVPMPLPAVTASTVMETVQQAQTQTHLPTKQQASTQETGQNQAQPTGMTSRRPSFPPTQEYPQSPQLQQQRQHRGQYRQHQNQSQDKHYARTYQQQTLPSSQLVPIPTPPRSPPQRPSTKRTAGASTFDQVSEDKGFACAATMPGSAVNTVGTRTPLAEEELLMDIRLTPEEEEELRRVFAKDLGEL